LRFVGFDLEVMTRAGGAGDRIARRTGGGILSTRKADSGREFGVLPRMYVDASLNFLGLSTL
jgi:hypothetical protein